MKAMLAESVQESRLPRYIEDDDWVFEQKLDGHRVLVRVDNGVVTPLNRNGVIRTHPTPRAVLDQFWMHDGDWHFDGELVDGKLWIFDLLEADRLPPDTHYEHRRHALERIFEAWGPDPRYVGLSTVHYGNEKAEAVERFRKSSVEGVIMRRLNGRYVEGKRTSVLLKVKFRHTVDCEVKEIGRDGKDNMVLQVYDSNGRPVEIGECTALAGDGAKVRPGDVVEITYLYVHPGSQRLFQPTLPRIRDDKAPTECLLDQLHYASKEVLQ